MGEKEWICTSKRKTPNHSKQIKYMIDFTDDQWNALVDEVDQTVTQAQDDLPEVIREKACQYQVIVDKYQFLRDEWKNMKVLGCYMAWTNGPIAIFTGQVYEDCHQDMTATMESVRHVYYHELAHAIGNLSEFEVRERGL
jgi:predicted Zn-dependent protease with MMP-like domain